MRVLFLADTFPFPAITGGKQRTSNILKQMSKENNIDFLCICEDKEKIEEEEIIKLVDSYEIVNKNNKSIFKRLSNLFTVTCDNIYLMYNNDYEILVNKYISDNIYDVIYVDSLVMYQYIFKNEFIDREKTKIILDLHNVENEVFKRMINKENSVIKNIYLTIEHKKMKRAEKKYINTADLIFTVSERDRKEYIKLFNIQEKNIKVIRNGVDITQINTRKSQENREEYILFVGFLKYRPNFEGIKWFIRDIWPNMNREFNNLKLYVVGKKGDEDIPKYRNVEYLGFVDNLDDLYKNSSAVVVPIKSGSGTRLKVVEAIKYKVPVISTDIGAEGLELKNEKEILIANKSDEYIKYYNMLRDKDYKDNICNNAYERIVELFDWNKIGTLINLYIIEVTNR